MTTIAVAAEHWTFLMQQWRTRFTVLGLIGLLTYLVVGQALYPGFTDYWGYMVFQMVVTLALLVAGEIVFRDQGGLSWITHVIAVATGYADVFGTAGHLYSNWEHYDKITHFFGTAAVTAGAYDCLRCLRLRGVRSAWVEERFAVALGIGVLVGIGWEVWELIGDKVLNTSRIGGWHDTTNDLIFDTLGALTTVFLLWRSEQGGGEQLVLEDSFADAGGPPSA